MKYDFDEALNRRNTNSYKWDTAPEGILPMWVADMDFKTAPAIIEALRRRVDHGVFGYTHVPKAYYDSIVRWFHTRHNWEIDPDTIIYTTGVVPAISAILKGLTHARDKVIVMPPVYNLFYSSVRNNGCTCSECQLLYDSTTGRYTIDFDDLERRAAQPNARFLLLCNPHNPAGRVWTREELTRIGEICLRHEVTVISDEIHCELTYAGHDYTPYQSLGHDFAIHSVACISPSKAFNTAGLQIANIVAPDEHIRRRVDRGINDNEVCDVNPFGVEGLMAAYNHSADWLDALRGYLWANYEYLLSFFRLHLPQYLVTPLEGTYLVWVNCSATGLSSEAVADALYRGCGVRVNPEAMYNPNRDHSFIRLNIACPRAQLEEALQRMQPVLASLINGK